METKYEKPLYEGKAKCLYATGQENILRMHYKDSATAGNGEKKEEFANKGKLNKAITLAVYRMLEKHGIDTHLVSDLGDTDLAVEKLDIIPLEVIVRNVAAGSFSKRMKVAEGTVFNKPIVEFSYKDDALGDPFINDDYAREMGAATPAECAKLKKKALCINELLKTFFREAGLILVDFKLEFGRVTDIVEVDGMDDDAERVAVEHIVLADEITPDTCRFWDIKTGKKMDKDLFRQNIGGLIEAYSEVLNRINKNS